MSFVLIPAGTFMMGNPENISYEYEQLHRVTLTKSYYMQTTEVTQGQWKAVMGNNPSWDKKCGDRCPVANVFWHEALEFINKINTIDKRRRYRLPTEAEWEYASRAGTATMFFWGNKADCSKANFGHGPFYSDECESVNIGVATKSVMNYLSNKWGLFDMHGNVWEWCQDWYGKYSIDDIINPTGPAKGHSRVLRGGCWHEYPKYCTSFYRSFGSGNDPLTGDIGFRLCASINP